MTMNDKQNDKQIENALKNMQTPTADKQAKKRAVNLAMAEFEKQHSTSQEQKNQKSFQGFAQWFRPIREITSQIRRFFMNTINNKVVYSALGSVCIAALCFGLMNSMMPTFKGSQTELKHYPITSKSKEGVAAVKKEQADAMIARNATTRPEMEQSMVLEEVVVTAQDTSSAQAQSGYQPDALNTIAESEPARENRSRQVAVAVDSAVALGKSRLASAPAPHVLLDHDDAIAPAHSNQSRDKFEQFDVNPIKLVSEEPVSTFSVDVDTSSYSFVRRQLNYGQLPQQSAVRAEEMINYFDYHYDVPETREQPFKPTVYVTPTPWNKNTKLIHIGIKGYEIDTDENPASNLVFLLDVSGSMNAQDKLPLVKQSMAMLLDTLNPDDTISIVVYAGAAGTVLEPTKVQEKQKILSALKRLQAGGSTAGAQGIKLAYELAEANFDKDAVNRVILATDGDFNVGITDNKQLQEFIESKRDKGIFLSILGFGQGNYQDHRMQTLAQNGNGVAAYIDTLGEAQKVLVDEASSMLFPIAKDVKIQVEFNPATVSEYRLIGYETRHLNREDFNNDKVDAGDIGAGHTVTAIYEVTPANSKTKSVDEHRYQQKTAAKNDDFSNEYAFLKIRYKLPNENKSKLITQTITYSPLLKQKANKDIEFATSVAAFAQMLQGGKYLGDYSYDNIIELARKNKGEDYYGYRAEFIQLVRKAKIAAM